MTQGSTDSRPSEAPDVLAMTSLASRQDLPQRVRQMLDGVLGLFWRNLERSLATTLDEFERYLIQQANKPRVDESGARCLESIRRIKPTRADLAPRFMLSLEDDLAHFDQRAATAAARQAAPSMKELSMELALVSSHDFDEALTLREMASRVEVRHTLPLYELGYRFGVLAARPAFDAETLPLGPGRITSALRYAVAALDLPLEHRILFYQTFDRFAMNGLGALYVAANAYLAEQRILKHLQLQTLNKNRQPAPAETRPPPREGSYVPQRTRAAAPTDDEVGGFGLAMFEVASSTPRAPSTSPRREARDPPHQRMVTSSPPELGEFTTLRGQLAARRRVQGVVPSPKGADAFEPGARELQAALGVLQVRSPPTIMLGGKVVQRTIAQLRQDLMNQLRHATPAGQTPRLADEDYDTVELVGLLFEQLMAATRPNGRSQSMMTRLQVPILRVALRDKRFFAGPDHPARHLLNSVADAGTRWLDDGAEGDPVLLERMQRAIDRINSEYDTDVRVFDQVNDELMTYVQTLARKAEVAERRLVEACRGREKLALARDTAGRAITIRLATAKPGRLLRTLLEQAWTDVLALTVLRQGEKSETYRRQLAVADQLVAAGGAMHTMRDNPLAGSWREEIENGLTQVGYHADEVQAVVDRLFASEPAADDDHSISQTDLAMRLKSKMRLGETAEEAPQRTAPQRPLPLALNAEETQTLERLKSMAFGTWFDVRGSNEEYARVRLSWFSPLSGRCLLTSQRGGRVDERGLDQVARDVVGGRLRIDSGGERDGLLDRCWTVVVEALARIPQDADVPLR